MTLDLVSLGWQLTALLAVACLVRVASWVVTAWESRRERTTEVLELEVELGAAREQFAREMLAQHTETKAWLDNQRNAHATILENHLQRIKALEETERIRAAEISSLSARVTSLEQVNEVTRDPPAPGAIGPFLPRRKAGTT